MSWLCVKAVRLLSQRQVRVRDVQLHWVREVTDDDDLLVYFGVVAAGLIAGWGVSDYLHFRFTPITSCHCATISPCKCSAQNHCKCHKKLGDLGDAK